MKALEADPGAMDVWLCLARLYGQSEEALMAAWCLYTVLVNCPLGEARAARRIAGALEDLALYVAAPGWQQEAASRLPKLDVPTILKELPAKRAAVLASEVDALLGFTISSECVRGGETVVPPPLEWRQRG
jgi:hypothetical protein